MKIASKKRSFLYYNLLLVIQSADVFYGFFFLHCVLMKGTTATSRHVEALEAYLIKKRKEKHLTKI
jgi:hypothetical protein